ncbi:hypothetical protein Pelo_19227 [Pelomyxa schiedti]|nr:hypothetical protein Pelo_19227 [Pelomyxa schiedti]
MSRLIGLGGDGTATPLSVALQSARDALNASAQSQSQSQSQAQAPQLGKSQTRAGPAVIPVGPAALTTTGTGSSGSSSSSVVTWLTNVFSPVTSLLDKTELAEITDSTYTEFEHILTTVLPVNFVESANAFVNSTIY